MATSPSPHTPTPPSPHRSTPPSPHTPTPPSPHRPTPPSPHSPRCFWGCFPLGTYRQLEDLSPRMMYVLKTTYIVVGGASLTISFCMMFARIPRAFIELILALNIILGIILYLMVLFTDRIPLLFGIIRRFQEWLQLMPPFLLQRHQAEDVNADEEAAAANRIILPELQNAPAHATADEIVLAED
nr:SUMO-specific isopeptidase USPL1 isoform X1 [Ipomoea trifida]